MGKVGSHEKFGALEPHSLGLGSKADPLETCPSPRWVSTPNLITLGQMVVA